MRKQPYRRLFRLRARDVAAEVDDEIAAHVQMRVEDLVRRGWGAEAARAEAVRRFGDLGEARRRLRATAREREGRIRMREWLESVRQDAAYAVRQARRAPGFTALAVLTFALGIGATTAVFTVVDGVLLRPLPLAEPERLLSLQSVDSSGGAFPAVSVANWLDWRERNRTLEDAAVYSRDFPTPVLDEGGGLLVAGRQVSGNFFAVVRPPMLVGRPFTEQEAEARAPVAVVGERLWRRVLGADPRLARPLHIGDRAYTVVGVVADSRAFPSGTELWTTGPLPKNRGPFRNYIGHSAVGRLKPGVTLAQADADLDAIAAAIRAEEPGTLYSYGVGVFPLRTALVGDVSAYLSVLLGAVGFVLLIVCANLASANLARGTARAHEMAVRVALGAGRGRLLRQLLVEHTLPALAGGAAGVWLAVAGVRAFLASSAAEIPRASEVGVDVRVLAFALVVSVVAGLLSGLLPALQASGRGSLRNAIALGGGRGAVRGARTLPGAVLIAAEIALALVLLAGAGLLIRSFRTLLGRGLGFDSRGMVMADVTLSPRRYADSTRSVAYWEALLASLGSVPGVTAAGAANWVPLGNSGTSFVELADRPGEKVPGAGYRAVSDGYFRALGVPLLSGRFFGPGDVLGSERVAIVNRAAARLYWPGEPTPLGRSLRTPGMEGLRPAWLTVVGVVGDVRQGGLERDPAPEVYVVYRQVPMWARSMTAVVRGRLPAEQLVGVVRQRVRALDPQIVTDVEPFAARLDQSIAERRLIMSLLAGFGAFALALAAIGVYGVLSFGVAQRTREIAVRAALGAERGRLLRLVLGGALRVVAAGVAAGLVGAYFLTALVRTMLVDVRPTDPLSFAAATLILVAVGLAAGFVPAWRAARVDPAEALRVG
ncbi:MAG TPA: ABC transporter permease [Gemmatimonadaceae bacterium]|nr:ABC transporter permease [Gemmatimonadaceae bacterium]